MNQRLERLRKFARLLDSQFQGPFGFKFGLDPLIGLVPVVGDMVTSFMSLYIIVEAYQLKCSPWVLGRMFFNIFLESLVKAVPIIGQIFDFFWKSNLKNMDLLESHLESPQTTNQASVIFLLSLVFGFALMMSAILILSVWLISSLIQFLSTAV